MRGEIKRLLPLRESIEASFADSRYRQLDRDSSPRRVYPAGIFHSIDGPLAFDVRARINRLRANRSHLCIRGYFAKRGGLDD